ncbi:MAG: type II secretion system protein [Candidatus Omnitrophica bacterium]|nr:type II secretion system protein [Candidatus Omnitrophota bacterium]
MPTTLPIGKNNAFTLVELLLAVSVLAFGLSMILQGYLTSLKALNRTEELITASVLLESKMDEVLETSTEEKGIQPGFASGDFEEFGDKRHRWELRARSVAEMPMVYEVELAVLWEESGRERAVTSTTLLDAGF